MSNAMYRKAMGKFINRLNLNLVNNEKDCLKCISKLSYMPRKIFDNNLVTIHKSKVKLNLNKPA